MEVIQVDRTVRALTPKPPTSIEGSSYQYARRNKVSRLDKEMEASSPLSRVFLEAMD